MRRSLTRFVIARVAGVTLLLYRTSGVAAFFLYEGSLGRGTAAERIATVAAHASDLRIACVLTLANALCALIIGRGDVLLHARRGCRAGDARRDRSHRRSGVVRRVRALPRRAGLDCDIVNRRVHRYGREIVREIGLSAHRVTMAASFFFAAANVAFAWLLLRARLAPRFVALIGLAGALVPLAGMPLQLIDATRGFFTPLLWVTMFLFELLFAFWLVATGGRDAEHRSTAKAL